MNISLADARNEVLCRFTREVKPKLIQANQFAKAQLLVPPPGTLVVYFTGPEQTLIGDIETALRAGDARSMTALAKKAQALVKVQNQPLSGRYIDALRSAECVFDVQYRGKPLAESLALLYGNGFGTATLAFLGGSIRASDIQIIEYQRGTPTKSPKYKYLIGYQAPKLTKIEQAAVDRLTNAEEGALIYPGAWPEQNNQKPMTEVADVAACMVHDAKGFDPGIYEDLDKQLASGKLDPHASVEELVHLRTELVIRGLADKRSR